MFLWNCFLVSLLIIFELPNFYSTRWWNNEKYKTEMRFNEGDSTNYPEIKLPTSIAKVKEEKGRSPAILRHLNKGKEDNFKPLVIKYVFYSYLYKDLNTGLGITKGQSSSDHTKNDNEGETGKLVANGRLPNHRNTRGVSRPDCRAVGTCDSNYGKQIPNCYCDSDCITFNDCCFDFPYNSTSLTSKRTVLKFEYMTCHVMPIPSMNPVENIGFYMVTKCPGKTLSASTFMKCVFGSHKELPVTDKDGVTYKNSDCARCHGVTSYEYWNVIVNLDICENIFFSLNNITDMYQKLQVLRANNCTIYWVPPTLFKNPSLKFPRFCIPEQFGAYNQNPKCKSYMNPVFIVLSRNPYKSIYTRNSDCISPSKFYTCARGKDAYDMLAKTESKINLFPPLTVLFNFKTKSQEICSNSRDSTRLSWNANCKEETFINYLLRTNVILESTEILSKKFFHRAMMMFYFSLPLTYYNITLYDVRRENIIEVFCGNNLADPITKCCGSNMTLHIQFGIPLSLYQIEKIKSSVLNMKFVYKESQISSLNKQFTVKRKLHDQNDTCDLRSGYTNKEQFHLSLRNVFILTDRLIMQTYPSHINAERFPNQSFCDVHVIFKNGSANQDLENIMGIKILNWTVSYLQFVRTNTINDISIQIPKTVLTYVTMSVSTVTLCVTVGIYLYFGISKSLAGNACTNVMITLIVANLLFMFGIGAIDNQLVCSVLGIILHYIWLCVFNWVSLYTLLVTKILIAIDKNPAFQIDQAIKKKTIYCLGYGIPVLVVVPCIIMTKFPNNLIEVQYGGSICFLSGYLANIIFFTGPVVGSLTFNLALLILSLKMLRKYNYAVINKSTKKTIQFVITFIKLCLISGLFWIFGILSQAIQSDFFEYLFIIIAGSQGLIVCLCFLTSFHVCVLCRSSQNTTHAGNSSQKLTTQIVNTNQR